MCGVTIGALCLICVWLIIKIHWNNGQAKLQENYLQSVIDDLDKKLEARIEQSQA